MDIESAHHSQREKLDFPELKCSLHKSQVILICTRPDCRHRIFLCPKCVSSELNHVNEHNPLMVYEDFIHFIAQSVGPNVQTSVESQELVSRRANHIGDFEENLKFQKVNISEASKNLSLLYNEKCEELVSSLEKVLENQHQIFLANFQKFEQEYRSDKEDDAEIPKFQQIRDRVRSMSDLGEIENYLQVVLRKKQSWLQASIQVRTLSNRTEDFYRESVQHELKHLPRFSNAGTLVAQWVQGFNKLIDQISSEASIFENLYPENRGIEAEIRSALELKLLTNSMIKADTHLKVLFENISKFEDESVEEAVVALSRLTNIEWLQISLERTVVSQQGVSDLLNVLPGLPQLSHLCLSFAGRRFNNSNELASALQAKKGLRHLALNLSETSLGDKALGEITSTLGELTNLTSLNLDFSANNLSAIGVDSLAVNISNLKNLRSLHINLGGYSFSKNHIGDSGLSSLAKTIGGLSSLQELDIKAAHNSLGSSAASDLALGIRELTRLNSLSLDLSHNAIQRPGVKKLGKAIALVQVRDLSLNLNNNPLKEGAAEIAYWLSRVHNLVGLHLNLRNIGFKQEEIRKFKADLLSGKAGKSYERSEILL